MTAPSDRPVLAEPMTPRHRAPALRVKLGEVFRLRARVCRACQAPFSSPDHHVRYCAACLATPCKGCGRAGEHNPSCWYVRRPPRLCRACRAPIGTAPPSTRYCEACRQDQCGYCGKYAGAHNPGCARVKHSRRVPLPVVNAVSIQMLLDVYVTYRPRAVRLARDIAGDEAEDIVQDVTVYLISRVETLTHVDKSLFLTSVKRAAVRRMTKGWHRQHLTMELDALLLVEAYAYHPGKRPYDGAVRLPAPPAAHLTHGKFSSVP